MDLGTVIGLFGGAALILLAVLMGGSALVFLNLPGLLIVIGGTLATAFIKFSMSDVINSVKVAMKAFINKNEAPEALINTMVGLASIARSEGLIALENRDPGENFARKAVMYLVDGYEQEAIQEILKQDILQTVHRHTIGQNLFKGMGDAAPAFGMIGTLIGLVQMLSGMSDPKTIGPAMAVALLTTLYGAMIANLVCLPLADKLALRSQQEQINKSLVIVAIRGIGEGVNPRILEESLKPFLSPDKRTE